MRAPSPVVDFPRRRWLFRTPVPLWFALAFVSGAALQVALGWHKPPGWADGPGHDLGLAVLSVSAVLLAWSLVMLRRAQTPPYPHARAAQLAVDGPYRWTRNPLYLSVTMAYLGLVLVYAQPLALLTLSLPLWLLLRVLVPWEEAWLMQHFGDRYRDYRARVPRWLPGFCRRPPR